jgi:hypothetical protein
MIQINDILNEKLNILYYGAGWPTNIGNAFIDLGSMELIRTAIPDSNIFFASEMPRWFFEYCPFDKSLIGNRFKKSRINNALDIASVTNCDLVVLSGMAMCEEFIKINGPTLEKISKNNIPILFVGTGAEVYTEKEKKAIQNFYKKINLLGFISRDDNSYDLFSDSFPVSEKGIDCGFFVADAYQPAKLNMPSFIAVTFDSIPEPTILVQSNNIIRAHHNTLLDIPKNSIKQKETLISDIPHDYLTLYANSVETHSDRVHACVAALSYGVPTKFYSNSPRGALFKAVGASNIKEKSIKLDPHEFELKKGKMIATVEKMISSI